MKLKEILEELLPGKLSEKEDIKLKKLIVRLRRLSGKKKEEEIKNVFDRINTIRRSEGQKPLSMEEFNNEIKTIYSRFDKGAKAMNAYLSSVAKKRDLGSFGDTIEDNPELMKKTTQSTGPK